MDQSVYSRNYLRGDISVRKTMQILFVLMAVLSASLCVEARTATCNCGNSKTAATLKTQCLGLAQNGDADICNKCPKKPTTTTTPAPTRPPVKINYRLPRSVLPTHYNIKLQPYMYKGDPKTFTFKGEVRIIVKCVTATNTITIHKKGLDINNTTLTFAGTVPDSSDPKFVGSKEDAVTDFYILKLDKNMKPGKTYEVWMEYTAPLTARLDGFYLGSYQQDNKTVYLATTQFSPTDARRAFPGFDEPSFKATFDVTLIRNKHFLSVSNMPIRSTSNHGVEDGITYVEDVYETTPIMPTYLLAFIVCDYEYLSAESNNVKFRSFARPDAKNSTKYILDTGIKVLQHLEGYMETKYPLPKLDFLAIADFKFGAMENWGAITFLEEAMLYEPGVSSQNSKERILEVLSHELSHMWFGNLVTPKWWTDLWVKEGFATFFELLSIDSLYPELKPFEKFVSTATLVVLKKDSIITSHPIVHESDNPNDILARFDDITYYKSCSVIRMMRHFLGSDTFRKGIVRLLRTKKYQNAGRNDVWQALEEQAKAEKKTIKVKDIMDTWLLQMNYPLVTVSRDANNANRIKVTQDRFLIDPSAKNADKSKSPFRYTWTIPITMTTSVKRDFHQDDSDVLWMDKTEHIKYFDIGRANLPRSSDPNGWILVNLEQTGFYRVNYDKQNWIGLINQLKTDHTVFPVINRGQLINDALNLARPGLLDMETALKTTEYLDKEMNGLPWVTARSVLTQVDEMISLTYTYGLFKKFMAEKSAPPFVHYGFNNTGATSLQTYARKTIVEIACKYEVELCVKEAIKLYNEWMAKPDQNSIDPDLRYVTYCTAIKHGAWREYSFAKKMYEDSNVQSEKTLLLESLACADEPWILSDLLSVTVDRSFPIDVNGVDTLITSIAKSAVGRFLAWPFYQANFDQISERYSNPPRVLKSVPSMTSAFNTPLRLQEVQNFIAKQNDKIASSRKLLEQAVENISNNIKWMELHYSSVERWLTKKYPQQ